MANKGQGRGDRGRNKKSQPPWTPVEKLRQIREIEDNKFNNEIILEKIERAIKSVRKESAPGLDKVEYMMLKCLSNEYLKIIKDIFNIIWIYGKRSEEWKEYQVFFIDKQDRESLRPIALSSCFGKLYYTKEWWMRDWVSG